MTWTKAAGIRVARCVAWNALGSAAAQGGSFLSSIIAARLLGKEIFGQFAMIQSTMIALSGFAGLGLGITATKYVSQYRSSDRDKLGRILGMSSMVAAAAALCFSAGLAIAAGWLPATIAPGFRLSALYILFITANAFQVGALAGFEAFHSVARIGLIYGATSVLLTWIIASYFGLPGAVLAQGLAALVLWALYQAALVRECRAAHITIRYRAGWCERAVLFRFSIPAAACGMVASLGVWVSNAILVRNAGFAELAIFSAAGSMRSMVIFVPALITRVSAPILNHMLANGDPAGYRRTFRAALVFNSLISLVLAAGLSLVGGRVLHLFGKEFSTSGVLLGLLLGSVVVEVIATSLFQTIFTTGRLWCNLGIVSLWTITLVVCTALSTLHYGAAGLAFAYLAGWTLSGSLYALAARRQFPGGVDFRHLAQSFPSCGAGPALISGQPPRDSANLVCGGIIGQPATAIEQP
jgi:O-antigen/teichoic acid export membrane protein